MAPEQCPEHLGARQCVRPAGHWPPRPHNDGHGSSWVPWDEEDEALSALEALGTVDPNSEESAHEVCARG